jgi:hypothetical protein
MQVPSTWQAAGDQNTAMIAPPGGIVQTTSGNGNLIYGVLTDLYNPDALPENTDIFSALIADLTRQNSGLEPGRIETMRVGEFSANSIHALNRSANNGSSEHDWIVGIPRHGAMRYFVFVCPEPDFPAMRPTFQHILDSIRLE